LRARFPPPFFINLLSFCFFFVAAAAVQTIWTAKFSGVNGYTGKYPVLQQIRVLLPVADAADNFALIYSSVPQIRTLIHVCPCPRTHTPLTHPTRCTRTEMRFSLSAFCRVCVSVLFVLFGVLFPFVHSFVRSFAPSPSDRVSTRAPTTVRCWPRQRRSI
jgi:hypothetical protein